MEATMATIEDVLDQVDGLRRDAADRVVTQFSSVAQLAGASVDQLTAIKGIGQVMADRILAAAKGAATAAPASAASTSGAASGSKGPKRLVGDALDRVSGTARKVVEPARKVVEPAARKVSEPARKVVDRAGGEARKVVERASGEAKKVADRAGGEAKKVVDKVTRRDR